MRLTSLVRRTVRRIRFRQQRALYHLIHIPKSEGLHIKCNLRFCAVVHNFGCERRFLPIPENPSTTNTFLNS